MESVPSIPYTPPTPTAPTRHDTAKQFCRVGSGRVGRCELLTRRLLWLVTTATSPESRFFDCSLGLRLNVTVQDWNCGPTGDQTDQVACSSHGLCAARPWAVSPPFHRPVECLPCVSCPVHAARQTRQDSAVGVVSGGVH